MSRGKVNDTTLWHDVWIEFEDANGRGCCGPDILLECDDRVLVVECKLTQTDVAEHQIFQLYAPCLRLMWAKPIIGVAIFRNLMRQPKNPVLNIWDLVEGELLDHNVFNTYHLTV